LAKNFLDEFVKDNKLKNITISNDAKDKLMRYSFPGNVRELKSIIDLAAVMCNGKEIQEDDITYTSISDDNLFIVEKRTLRQYNCDIIKYFLKKNNNDVLLVSQTLDIGKSTIYKMIQEKEIII